MKLSASFRDGVKKAIPVWFAFVPISFAAGVAAKAHGLHWSEIVLMSALVYGGPSQLAALDRYLRYLSYALVVSVICISLFLSGARFEAEAAPQRSFALVASIVVALLTKSSLIGMLAGPALVLALSWVR